MTDSAPHDIWSTACECGCKVHFDDEGHMIITHQPHDPRSVRQWGVFEGEELPDDDNLVY